MEQKFYAKRDSATAMLRKAGVDKSQYKDYIFVHADKDNTGLPYAVWMHEGLPLTHAEAFARQELETKKLVKNVVDLKIKAAVSTPATIRPGSAENQVVRAMSKALNTPKNRAIPTKDIEADLKQFVEPIQKAAAVLATGTALRTVSSVCRMMVKAGRTNEQIWMTIKKEFNLADNKKHYPAWYRSEVNRKGL